MSDAILAIVNALGSLIAYFAIRGIDKIIGKYLAMIQIAFDKSASESARKEYRDTMNSLALDLPKKYDSWEEWRKKHGQKT